MIRSATTALLLLAAPVPGQNVAGAGDASQDPENVLALDGDHLTVESAVYDPWGTFVVRGRGDDTVHELHLHAPPFALDPLGEYTPGDEDADPPPVTLGRVVDGSLRTMASGRLELRALNDRRVAFTAEGTLAGGAEIAVQCMVVPEVRRRRPARITGRPDGFGRGPQPSAEPSPEDLVVCVLGNPGTGLPGQRRVAGSMRWVAERRGLDLVLVPGDLMLPRIVPVSDPAWRQRFEEVYDASVFDVPFYGCVGDNERRGGLRGVLEYGRATERWTVPKLVYHFERTAHGKKILFVVTDTTVLGRSVRHHEVRHARRHLENALALDADWRIVMGHHAAATSGQTFEPEAQREPDATATRGEVLFGLLPKGADVYVAGSDHHLEVSEPIDGVTHVLSGGGGGPEAAGDARWTERTLFARTGGGTVWLRFRPDDLEIVVRDPAGEPLFVRRLPAGDQDG